MPNANLATYGTVDYFVTILRVGARTRHDVYVGVAGTIETITEQGDRSAEERIAEVRNALAAAELVRAEIPG